MQRAIQLDKLLQECNFPSVAIHASMKQEERIKMYQNFKDFKHRILVSTDIWGRCVYGGLLDWRAHAAAHDLKVAIVGSTLEVAEALTSSASTSLSTTTCPTRPTRTIPTRTAPFALISQL